MSKVRIGIIGTGGMCQGHIDALLSIPDAEIAALCDNVQGQMDKSVARHPELAGIPQFLDYKAMIAAGGLDAIHIDTPHTLHFEQIMAGFDAGLHVFCEKPMCCTVADAKAVLKRADEVGKTFVLGYQRSFSPSFMWIKDEIASGKWGPIQFVQALQSQEWLRAVANTWRHDPALSGGGQLNDSGSHVLAIIFAVTGLTVQSVHAFSDNFTVPVDINTAINLKFVGGAQGNISIVGNGPAWHEDFSIWCEHGMFMMRNGKLEVLDTNGKRFSPDPADMRTGNTPDSNFVNAILGREEIGSKGILGLRVIELTEAAWESAKTGKVVDVKVS